MTYQQIIHKVPCPTCGVARGKACGTGAGRFRLQAHDERAAKAFLAFGLVDPFLSVVTGGWRRLCSFAYCWSFAPAADRELRSRAQRAFDFPPE
jgi:hypothetical protein